MRGFDARARYRALDTQRAERELSWPGVARELWEMSSELAKRRGENHPIAASTLRNVAKRGDTSCQHALVMLRWLGRDPEDFVPGAPPTTRAPLPIAGPDRRLRRHLHATPRRDVPGLFEALDQRRRDRELAWPALARELRCGPSQRTGLRTARFAVRMTLAMAIRQWLERPAQTSFTRRSGSCDQAYASPSGAAAPLLLCRPRVSLARTPACRRDEKPRLRRQPPSQRRHSDRAVTARAGDSFRGIALARPAQARESKQSCRAQAARAWMWAVRRRPEFARPPSHSKHDCILA